VIGAIVAEWINAERGLGVMVIQQTFSFNSVLLWGAIVMSIALAVAFYLLVVVIDDITARHVVR
jgi:NitT/TauT family transport system permease protein